MPRDDVNVHAQSTRRFITKKAKKKLSPIDASTLSHNVCALA